MATRSAQAIVTPASARTSGLAPAAGASPVLFSRSSAIAIVVPRIDARLQALIRAYHRGAFASRDTFIAFLGLDVRRRESGYFKGKRKLTKRGPVELRRLLYCAAKPAR